MNGSQHAGGVIVVGVDGSSGGNHALRWALDEASVRGSSLSAIHAWDTPMPISAIGSIIAPADPELYETEAKSILDEAVGGAATQNPTSVTIEPSAVRGYPPKVLLHALDHADLLVLGSRGRGGFRGLLLGSVGQHCAQHANRPVAIVSKDAPLPDAADVVVGVDGSPSSHLALQWAIDEAAARHARLAVVHAWWAPYVVLPVGVSIVPLDRHTFIEGSTRMLHEMADGALSRAVRRPADVQLLPIEAPAAQGLLDRSKNAGMLVVGSRGRGGLAGLLLGSVSQQCLHHAECAVVVVPEPRDKESS